MNPYDFYITPEEYDQAAAIGIRRQTLTVRIRRFGWDKQRALTQPPMVQHHSAWRETATSNGISPNTFYARIRSGWSEERAAITPLHSNPVELAAEARRKYPPELHALREANGIKYHTFISRIRDSGWDPLRAATEPVWSKQQVDAYGNQRYKEKYGKNPNAVLFPHRSGGMR